MARRMCRSSRHARDVLDVLMLPDADRHERMRRSLALALNHEWPQLERTSKTCHKLPAVPIPDAVHQHRYAIVATARDRRRRGTAEPRASSIQIVRVRQPRSRAT